MTALGLTVRVVRREMALERAAPDAVMTVLPLGATVVLLGGLSFGPRPSVLQATAPGVVWLAVLLAAVPLATRACLAERHDDAWDLLRAVCSPLSLVTGKVVAAWIVLLTVWLTSAVLALALFELPLPPAALPAAGLGTLGVACVTVVLGILLGSANRRAGLLAVLLLPGTVPVLLAGTQATTAGVRGLPWVALIAAFDVVVLTVTWAVIPALMEES